MSFEIFLANPRGFCAGVERAIAIVEEILKRFSAPVYVRHEVVHNRTVVEALQKKGAIFIEDLDEVPDNAVLVFSAHGVSKKVRHEVQRRGFKLFDATCPLVTKVHTEVAKMARHHRKIIMIGHAGHPEVEGTMGQLGDSSSSYATPPAQSNDTSSMVLIEKKEDVANLPFDTKTQFGYVTQTTLSQDDTREIIDALKQRFPTIESPKKDDICYATQNRQEAIKKLARICDLILIIGSSNSSNSNRLREVASKAGCEAYLLDTAADLNPDVILNRKKIGVSAGASAPESLVEGLLERLQKLAGFNTKIHHAKKVDEKMRFPLPASLTIK